MIFSSYPKNIDILLDLDGIIIEQLGGYWTKFEIQKLATPTNERPHGIRYSLTLHDRYGTRIMGFDNAHALKTKNKHDAQVYRIYDHHHRHVKDKGVPYKFINAHELLKDFWIEVDKTLKQLGIIEV